ncbi:hypothetical protein POM88_023694 [Heracleum sosnowskyi]|uniref:Kinesin motor domain-containing protein n=1 Tax=Heracleum sosnowskyi TaxID=360622 RepID=A0AAD8IHH7_9APIA|nr:hypothetical protein POM88_023694 [Heracleum sosnowskyi]
MEDECKRSKSGPNGELPQEAGVIPRAVQQIFDALEGQNAEYSVKVTFLELYNEEITDLLAPEELSRIPVEDKQKKQLPLMEDDVLENVTSLQAFQSCMVIVLFNDDLENAMNKAMSRNIMAIKMLFTLRPKSMISCCNVKERNLLPEVITASVKNITIQNSHPRLYSNRAYRIALQRLCNSVASSCLEVPRSRNH